MPKQTLIKIGKGAEREIFLTDKMAHAKAYEKKRRAVFMDKEIRKDNNERPKERINQFIVECMFSKYFEEERDNEILNEMEEIKV